MTGVSETARRVAAQRLGFERVPATYGDPRADELLSRDIAAGLPADGPLRRYLEARTRFFDTVVVRCLDAGITQVVVGAAGYDCRALRYAKPGVRWFEIDRGPTQEDKRERLARIGIGSPHVSFVPADFDADDVRGALASHGFDDASPALFLLEGVAVYLERSTLDSVLRQFAGMAAPRSRLAISLSVSGVPGSGDPGSGDADPLAARRAAFRAAVAAIGEPVRSSVGPNEVDDLLGSAGWTRTGEPSRAGLVVAERLP